MRICQKCHSPINEQEIQCPRCGVVLGQLFCSHCNTPLDLRYGYCLTCHQPYSLPYKHSYEMRPLNSQRTSRRVDQARYASQRINYEHHPAAYQFENPLEKEASIQKQKTSNRKSLIYSAIIILIIATISAGGLILRNANSQSNVVQSSTAASETTPQSQAQDTTTQPASQSQVDVEGAILDILDNTQVHSMFAPTIGNMIVAVFHNFEITYEAKQGDTSSYYVTIEGSYSPHPDYPNMSLQGKIVYFVNIERGSCQLYSDPNSLNAIFLTYITY